MKAQALRVTASKPSAKRAALRAAARATSRQLSTMAIVAAAATAWFGACAECPAAIAAASAVFIAGFTPRALRLAARDLRREGGAK